MFNMIEYQQAHTSKPLDETMWRTWLKKNLLEERQRAVARIKVVKWACIGALMATGIVSPYVSTPNISAYQTVVRFVIALGASSCGRPAAHLLRSLWRRCWTETVF